MPGTEVAHGARSRANVKWVAWSHQHDHELLQF